MSKVERVHTRNKGIFFIIRKIVESAYLLKGVSSGEIINGILDESVEIRHIPVGEKIVKESEPDLNEFFILLGGKVQITRLGHPIFEVLPTAIVGDVEFVDSDPNNVTTVTAIEPTVIISFSREFVDGLCPESQRNIYKNLACELGKKFSIVNNVVVQKDVKLGILSEEELSLLKQHSST